MNLHKGIVPLIKQTIQLKSIKRLVLTERYNNESDFDGREWCKTIALIHPNLEQLTVIRTSGIRMNAIKAHLDILSFCKCQFVDTRLDWLN